ncbi:MAG TPA: twin-arginine translocase subunit TatC [Myxococcaceae bacterium]|nr:twin-arginine translocase subunit TatC [Myxococcaceae bacterium]
MSLFEHLAELRSRLIKCTIAVLVLGLASLIFAKPIFGILMKPVLSALPAGNRSLIYTSGIEELNVLMKVGLYCGLFLTTPVILWQIWGFVAPGLYEKEKKMAAPFVLLGSLAFMTGALFCYFVMLPTMFQFLLNDEDATELSQKLDKARLREQDALRFVRVGDGNRAQELVKSAGTELSDAVSQVSTKGLASQEGVVLSAELDSLGKVIDALYQGAGPSGRSVLRRAVEEHQKAVELYGKGDFSGASKSIEDAAVLLGGVGGLSSGAVGDLWSLEKQLARAKAVYEAKNWTRPMLTMREQLSLVLLLLLAFGIIFELPLVMAVLSMIGLVKARFLMKYQRHAFVVCLILAAVITPTGDAVNLALMTGPMVLCYELGVLAAWMIEKRKARQAATTALTTTAT